MVFIPHLNLRNKNQVLNPLSVNPTKWSNALKQLADNSQQIAWVFWNILWSWRLKG